MVLCAVSADHTHIKLLEAPHTASAGDRITFPGFTGEAASSAQMAKKKILEKLAPQVKIIFSAYFLYLIVYLSSDKDIYFFLAVILQFFVELALFSTHALYVFYCFNVIH
jgi:hypothetical protein